MERQPPPSLVGCSGGARGGLGFGQRMELGQNNQISGTQPLQRGRCRGFFRRDPCTWRLLYATIPCKIKKTPCVCKPHPVLTVAREGLLGTPAVAMRDCRSSSGSPLLWPSGWYLHGGLFGPCVFPCFLLSTSPCSFSLVEAFSAASGAVAGERSCRGQSCPRCPLAVPGEGRCLRSRDLILGANIKRFS